jgi:hypothetical protein
MQVQSQSQSRRIRRPGQRPAAWLALLAVWLQALLPAVHHPAGMAMAGGFSALELSSFCHAPNPAGTAPTDPGRAPAHSLPACALCQAVHAIGGFTPPPPLAVGSTTLPRDIAFATPDQASEPRRQQHSPQQPRAPPILA